MARDLNKQRLDFEPMVALSADIRRKHGKLPVSLPAANDPENTLYPYGYGLSY